MGKQTKSKIHEIFVRVDRTGKKIWGFSAEMLVEMLRSPRYMQETAKETSFLEAKEGDIFKEGMITEPVKESKG